MPLYEDLQLGTAECAQEWVKLQETAHAALDAGNRAHPPGAEPLRKQQQQQEEEDM
jgi:hypothetical protein